MEADRVLAEALEAVKKAKIPTNLQEIAFSKAVELLTTANAETPGPPGGRSAKSPSGRAPSGGLGEVAKFFGIDSTMIEEFFTEHEEGLLHVEIDAGRLGDNAAERTRAIAVLLITARQVGQYDSGPTAVSVIRTECDRHGTFDRPNFAKHMKAIDPYFVVGGSGPNKTYRLKPSGREEAKRIFAKLTKA